MSRRPPARNDQAGFSLIELLLAMALFSFGLLVIAVGFIGLFGIYQSGVVNRETQANSRVALDRIVQISRQATSFNAVPGAAAGVLCVDGPNLKYYLDTGTNRLMEGPWNPDTSVCAAGGGVTPITAADVQVAAFGVEQFAYNNPSPGVWVLTPCTFQGTCQLQDVRVDLRLTNSIADLDSTDTNCLPNRALACAVTSLSTSITARGPLP